MSKPAPALASVILLLVVSSASAQQDVIAVGDGVCKPSSVRATLNVPIYVRDFGGTLLGNDQPLPGHTHGKIQSISFRLRFEPATAVVAKSIARAGILANRQPVTQIVRQTETTLSFFVVFDELRDPLAFSSLTPAPGDLIATLSLQLAAVSQQLTIRVDPSPTVTLLADQRGELYEDFSSELRFVDGCITITGGRRRAVRK